MKTGFFSGREYTLLQPVLCQSESGHSSWKMSPYLILTFWGKQFLNGNIVLFSHPHKLRTSFISHFKRAEIDYKNIQEKLELELNPSPYCENVFSYLYDEDTTYTNKQF